MDQASDNFDTLADEIIALCADIHGRESRLIDRIRRIDALKLWRGEITDCAHWLNVHCGMDLVTAREKVRIARSLDDLPLIHEAFRNNELSYSKVRAITRIAEPDTEAELIDLAKSTTAEHVVRLVRARRQADHLAAPGAALDAWRHRYLDCHTASDGSVVFEGRLPGELGALLLQALDRASEWLRSEDHPGMGAPVETALPGAVHGAVHDEALPERQQAQARRADALAALAERFLAASPSSEESLNTADRYLITVHASAEALPADGNVDPADPPQFEGGSVMAAETVRRLGCDAAVLRVLESAEGEPLDVGRKTRVIPPALRRALKRRDGGCRFPDCTHTRFVDGHHIVHWADGGETRLDNLVLLCRHHHRLLHEGGYRVVKDGAAFRFFRCNGVHANGVEARTLPRKRLEGLEGLEGLEDEECLVRPPQVIESSRWQRATRRGSASLPASTGPPSC